LTTQNKQTIPSSRLYALLLIFLFSSFALVARAVNLQVMETDFLQGQGKARFLREVTIASTRGVIKDRNGEPLAVSTPVDSVWVHPGELLEFPENIQPLAKLINGDADEIERKLTQRKKRGFVWMRRRLNPVVADQIRELNLPGVYLQKEYRRFYPAGEVTSHVIGFTNIDDVGQEGLELAYDSWLAGSPGSKHVIKDRKGQTVEEIELIKESDPGNDLHLSIDKRLQYLAYRELKSTVLKHGARSGSVVVLDVNSGEVLAMVNQPSYNPNDPGHDTDGMRNRAVTDVIEPGSVMKPIAMASALENKITTPTNPAMSASPSWPCSLSRKRCGIPTAALALEKPPVLAFPANRPVFYAIIVVGDAWSRQPSPMVMEFPPPHYNLHRPTLRSPMAGNYASRHSSRALTTRPFPPLIQVLPMRSPKCWKQ
jgi:cell division protein FtsI (penicillin-binding protein 3)